MIFSSIRYGPGVTYEVGMDFQNMEAKKIAVITDKNVVSIIFSSSNTNNKEYKLLVFIQKRKRGLL